MPTKPADADAVPSEQELLNNPALSAAERDMILSVMRMAERDEAQGGRPDFAPTIPRSPSTGSQPPKAGEEYV